MSPLFETAIMVDWSAAAAPRTGKDSIWLALYRSGAAAPELLENPATRLEAMARLAGLLESEAAAGRRVLAGFDFPFGYPEGAADRIAPGRDLPWRRIWRLLVEEIEDGARNANNRFDVAERLNREAFDGEGPFWGRPWQSERAHLPAKKPSGYGARYPEERRLVERRQRSTQPVWKLNTTGSVGGQTLMGIAALERLRRDPAFENRLAIWPFEPEKAAAAPLVIAEIYPSIFPEADGNPVKDARQVLGTAARLAALDAEGALGALIDAPRELPPAERRLVETEEAWILGVPAG